MCFSHCLSTNKKVWRKEKLQKWQQYRSHFLLRTYRNNEIASNANILSADKRCLEIFSHECWVLHWTEVKEFRIMGFFENVHAQWVSPVTMAHCSSTIFGAYMTGHEVGEVNGYLQYDPLHLLINAELSANGSPSHLKASKLMVLGQVSTHSARAATSRH